MTANDTVWRKVFNKWNETKDDTFLEYLLCPQNVSIATMYLMMLMKNEMGLKDNKRAYLILVIVSHISVQNNKGMDFILEHLRSIEFSVRK